MRNIFFTKAQNRSMNKSDGIKYVLEKIQAKTQLKITHVLFIDDMVKQLENVHQAFPAVNVQEVESKVGEDGGKVSVEEDCEKFDSGSFKDLKSFIFKMKRTRTLRR